MTILKIRTTSHILCGCWALLVSTLGSRLKQSFIKHASFKLLLNLPLNLLLNFQLKLLHKLPLKLLLNLPLKCLLIFPNFMHKLPLKNLRNLLLKLLLNLLLKHLLHLPFRLPLKSYSDSQLMTPTHFLSSFPPLPSSFYQNTPSLLMSLSQSLTKYLPHLLTHPFTNPHTYTHTIRSKLMHYRCSGFRVTDITTTVSYCLFPPRQPFILRRLTNFDDHSP